MKEVKRHITIATSEFPPQPGGIGNHAYHLALELSKNRYQVTVIADQRSLDGVEEVEFDRHLPFTVKRIAFSKPRFLMYVRRLIIFYTSIDCSYHVFATGKFSLWSVAFCSYFRKRHYLAIVHGTEVNFKKPLLKWSINAALKRFKTIIAVSHYTKQLIAHLGLHVVVIPNGIDVEEWTPKTLGATTIIGSPKLITVGNVTSRKGQQQVIKHLPVLVKEFPDVHYHCIGLPTEATAFQQLAETLGVSSHVTFHGRLEPSKLKALLSNCDVFVMLSQETKTGDVEGFGIAILEANALEVPAIGSKGCGIEDAINHGQSGILINATNPQEFLEAIKTIQQDVQQYRKGALDWSKQHGWPLIIHQYLEFLR